MWRKEHNQKQKHGDSGQWVDMTEAQVSSGGYSERESGVEGRILHAKLRSLEFTLKYVGNHLGSKQGYETIMF